MRPSFSDGKQSPEPLPSSLFWGRPAPSPPCRGATSTCGKVATLVESFNKENSRVIHLSTQSRISSAQDVTEHESSTPAAARGRAMITLHCQGVLSMRSPLIGSCHLPAIWCYFFFFFLFKSIWVLGEYGSLETHEKALFFSISLFWMTFR